MPHGEWVFSSSSKELLMTTVAWGQTVAAPVRREEGRWALTRTDVVLCALPICPFLSIVSLV